ncbi:hypothetical protein DQ238_16120 [Geodermatophilus sp. TF02-6]|uniref:copper chaperone PCu(A)C n=1 Tax=Geodermatophilus sp. TF02-6 TaxID=2250575 RepID=UPI000E0774F6|nr:copper chaperone PCu(A)C [Geodermatophilus sp. TF02-6]RBY76796.1 hypothetical protein DQ238_16120 [Geodermatophilus sp. TF02-6]
MNRALRAATIGALLLSPVALTACSAGQVSQTATQNRDKVGPEAEAGDITLRQIQLAYPADGRYAVGDAAELQMAIVNSSNEADTLVGIEGDAFDGAVVTGRTTASPAVPGSPSATPSGTPSATPGTVATESTSPGASATPSTLPGASATPSTLPGASATSATPSSPATPTTVPAPATASASTRVDIPVPPRSTVFLGGADGLTVELVDLSEELTSGQSIQLTLTFERAGDITTQALVATPDRALPRGEGFDFHDEAAPGRDAEQDTETE